MSHFQIFLLLFIALFYVISCDVTCPTSHITASGTWPSGAQNPVDLPNNFDCQLQFDIPDGFIFKLTTTAYYKGDGLIFLSDAKKVYNIPVGVSSYTIPAKNATLSIATKDTKVSFLAYYVFYDVRNYTQNAMKTGDYLSLRYKENSYTTFTSQTDQVALSYATSTYHDTTAGMTYVYDGSDLSAPYLGVLSDFTDPVAPIVSTGRSISIVNFDYFNWLTQSTYVLANDYKTLSPFTSYQLLVTDGYHPVQISAKGTNLTAYTIINANFIESLTFNSVNPEETLNFVPMTPTHKMMPVVSFTHDNYQNNIFPYRIPAQMFSITIQNADISLKMNSSLGEQWLTAQAGRKIMIYSRSVWNPQESSEISTNEAFFKSSTVYKFSLTSSFLNIASPGGKLHFDVKYSDGKPVLDRDYQCDNNQDSCVKNTTTPAIGKGTACSVTYDGTNPKSLIFAQIDILENGVGQIGWLFGIAISLFYLTK